MNSGRLLVAENCCSTVELFTFLKNYDTNYCGTLRKNKKIFEQKAKLKPGKIKGWYNQDDTHKYHDKKKMSSLFLVFMAPKGYVIQENETEKVNYFQTK